MIVLGIETSCDETAAAIVTDKKEILSHVLFSQIKKHATYGGVVPEIAARAHLEALPHILKQTLDQANCRIQDLSGIAATGGPGLIGGVIVGTMAAKGLALGAKKPFIAVNHLEAHALTIRLVEQVSFPYLLLLMSGGHCQFLWVEGVGHYTKLGQTLDDALGETFDKVGKMLGFPYPAGPRIEEEAKGGDETRFSFPLPLAGRPGCDFSFSGLKTAVKTTIDKFASLTDQDKKDICASFQKTVAKILKDRLSHALKSVPPSSAVLAGGVAANRYLLSSLQEIAPLHVAPPSLCTDNGAMVAWAGLERLRLGLISPLDFAPRPRWPLEEIS